MNFQQFNLLNQIVHVIESIRRDIRKNCEFAKTQFGILPTQKIIDIHMTGNATQYVHMLDRVQLAYNAIGTPDEIATAMASIGMDAAEGLAAYAELRAAADLILTTPLATDADIAAVCGEILLPTGTAYVVPNDPIF